MAASTRPASALALAAAAASLAAGWTAGPAAQEVRSVVMNPTGNIVPPELGTGMVSGVVLDAVTGQPVPGAVVYLGLDGRGRAGQQSRQITDSRGRFVFVEVPASDRLTVSASRAGYLPGGYARDEAPGARGGRLAIADGQWIGDVRIELSRTGSISGTVIDERGDPVVGVWVRTLVRLTVAGRTRLAAGTVTTTDDRGAYRIPNLVPGRYLVQVPSVQAAVPASASTADIAGWTPERIATARARGQGPNIPAEKAVPAGDGARVVLGRYPIPPPPSGGRQLAYPAILHLGAMSVAEAATIDLGSGEHRGAVDVRLAPVPAVQVAGRVDGPPESYPNLTLRLVPSGFEDLGLGSETATALVASDGSFRFANVPAGSYIIDAPSSINEFRLTPMVVFGPPFGRPPGVTGTGTSSSSIGSGPPGSTFVRTTIGRESALTGRVAVPVGEVDVADVVVALRPSARMTGHVRYETDPNQPPPAQLPLTALTAEPADGSPSLGLPRVTMNRNDPSGAFVIEGLRQGRYLLRSPLGLGWRVKSIVHEGRDYTDVPFDTTTASSIDGVVVTLTNALSAISGSVRDGQGAPAAGARVVVFPADPARWTHFGLNPPWIRSAFTNNLGTFHLDRLPAGSYLAVALADATRQDWRDPAFFERASRTAARIAVDWGETGTRELVLTEVR